MAKKPKPYQPSAEELALKAAQLEELKSKESELNEQKKRSKKGAKASRSLIKQQAQSGAKQTLGA